jgi:hypothetical protein
MVGLPLLLLVRCDAGARTRRCANSLLRASLSNFDQLATGFNILDKYRDMSSLPKDFNNARLLRFTHDFKDNVTRNCDDG